MDLTEWMNPGMKLMMNKIRAKEYEKSNNDVSDYYVIFLNVNF